MGENEVMALRKKLEEQSHRLSKLEHFRELAKVPLPFADLYQFPRPDSKLSDTQLLEVTRLLQNRLGKALRANTQLKEALNTEFLEYDHQSAEIDSLHRAIRDKSKSWGFSGSFEEFLALPEAAKATQIMEKDLLRAKNEIHRAESLEKELETRLQTMKSIEIGSETAMQYLSQNVANCQKAHQTLSELDDEISSIKQYLHETDSLQSDYLTLEKHNLQLQGKYQRLQDTRFRLDSRYRILGRDSAELQTVHKRVCALRDENANLKTTFLGTVSEVEAVQTAIDEMSAELMEVEQRRHVRCSTPTFLSGERTTLESATESASGKLHSLQQDLIRMKSEWEKLKQRRWEIEKENSDLRLKCDQAGKERKRIMDDISIIAKSKESMSKGKDSAEVASALEFEQCKCEIDSLHRKSQTLQSDLHESHLLISSLKADLAMVASACESLPSALQSESHLQAQLLETQTAISESRLEITSLSESLASLHRQFALQ